MEPRATCPLCDLELGALEGWGSAPENAIARHLMRAHAGWEQRLGIFADVLGELAGDGLGEDVDDLLGDDSDDVVLILDATD